MLENQKDKETLNLKVGDQAVFLRNTSLTPEDRGKATFVSSDPSVATVNERGVVTAHSTGSATIQVKFGSNETVVCKVTVTEKPKKKEPETPDTENRIPSVSDRPETPESGNTRPSQKIPSVGSVKKIKWCPLYCYKNFRKRRNGGSNENNRQKTQDYHCIRSEDQRIFFQSYFRPEKCR